MSDSPNQVPEETTAVAVRSPAGGRSTTVIAVIAVLALLIAIGHVIYALVRDHVIN